MDKPQDFLRDGKHLLMTVDHFTANLGIAVADRRSLVRIANVNTNLADNDAGMKALIDCIRDAFENIPGSMQSNVKIFCAPRVINRLSAYYNDHHVNTTWAQVGDQHVVGEVNIDGFRFVPDHQILCTEQRIKAYGEV